MREAPRGVTPGPSRVQDRRTRLLGAGSGVAFGWRGRPGPSGPDRFGVAGMLLSGGLVRRAPRFSGETEGRVLVENLKRVVAGRKARGTPTVRQGLGAPGAPSPRERAQKAQEGKTREAGSTAEGTGSGEANETQESIGPGRLRPPWGTDLRGEQDLEAAGHRDLLVLRAAERDVKNSRKGSGVERRTAPRRGNTLKGEPHEWHRPSRPEGAGGRKPSGG